ncbi:DNA polymerase II [Candidatus Woesearchaeota archaeon]|nr:DNA polymerase II [Candidatus Woesearchaeota archaeon]
MKAFVIYPTYKIEGNKAKVMLFGRLENGESFVTINDFKPYFWIRKSDKEAALKILDELKTENVEIRDSGFRNFDDEAVCKAVLSIPREVPELKKIFLERNIVCYEADIRFSYRFMIDHHIKGSTEIIGKHRKPAAGDDLYVDRIYENSEFRPAEYFPNLEMLSIDIETDLKGKQIFAISLYSKKIKKVLLLKEEGRYENAENFPDEKSLLENFKSLIHQLDPDVIIGWNLIDFDFSILKDKFRQYKIPFNLGRTGRECSIRLTESFFTDSSANFAGRAVIDGIHLMKVSFLRLPDYKLNTAAKEIMGDEKLITSAERGKEIEELYGKDPQKLVDYNLKDSILVYNILRKSRTLDLSVKRSLLTGMQLDRVNASIASMDSLYLRELKKRKIAAPSAFVNDSDRRIRGGYVMQSKPGIYEGIIVLDFKSLYPSVMRTFNIDPWSFVPEEKYKSMPKKEQEQLIEAPNGAHFKNQEGILPMILERLWKQRELAKKANDKLTNQAIKITMNSMFGVLANPTCRFYSLEMANGITHFGQFLNKLTAKKVEERGYEVIYGDTDSIFVNTKANNVNEAERIGTELQHYINDFYTKYVKQYNRPNFLEIEFEKAFKKFLMPKVRGSNMGAKKRYAGLIEKNGKEEITFTGLEFVRSDWTEVSKKFQMQLLDQIFHDKPVENYIKEFVRDLRNGSMDELLIYRKSIRKKVSSYIKTTPPHIKAARKIGRENPGMIEYVMTVNGPEPVEEAKSRLDYKHYIDKQIRPLADSILSFQDKSFDELTAKHKQTKLGGF